ncbi:hypothetical protein EJB05_56987, partial [Eragrostis curvula]
MERASSDVVQPALHRYLLPAEAPTGSTARAGTYGEAHTFASYLHLRKEGKCQVVMHPILREAVPCICCNWRNEGPAISAVHRPNAAEDTISMPDAVQEVEEGVPLSKLVFEGCTCLKCTEEICKKTNNLQDLAPLDSGRDKPLHHAAVTNNLTMFCHLITLVGEKGDHQAVIRALRETNERAETALHVAIIGGFRDMVELMLWVDPQLSRIACHNVTPIYLAVSLGSKEIPGILHEALGADAGQSYYSGPKGQNALHAAMQVGEDMMKVVLDWKKGKDNNGNTALHIAVDIQHLGINPDKVIYNMLLRVGAKHGSYRWDQIQQHYIPQPNQDNADQKEKEKQEKEESDKLTSATQTLGIGTVLITTVTFGATFALPGGYKADDHVNGGTPTLAGPWYFDAFMVANTLAFICSSVATVGLMYSGMALVSLHSRRIHFSIAAFFAANSITSLTTAFALGVYMVLAPVARSTAIAICAVSPLVLLYRYVQGLWKIYLVLIPIRARIGFWSAMMYAARAVLLKNSKRISDFLSAAVCMQS